jgi:hypothetical protein
MSDISFWEQKCCGAYGCGRQCLRHVLEKFLAEIYPGTPAFVAELLHCFLQSHHEIITSVHPSEFFLIPHVSYTDEVWRNRPQNIWRRRLRDLSPRANYSYRETAVCWRSKCPQNICRYYTEEFCILITP